MAIDLSFISRIGWNQDSNQNKPPGQSPAQNKVLPDFFHLSTDGSTDTYGKCSGNIDLCQITQDGPLERGKLKDDKTSELLKSIVASWA
jgi:hypothetical protein